MPSSTSADSRQQNSRDRRIPAARRHSILGALWQSSFARRRLGPRRDTDRHPVMTDWFQPQWLATAMIILVLSSVDAVLTLALFSRGAIQLNPFMEPLVRGSGHSFAFWKLGLTSIGMVVLTMAARLRVFRRVAVQVLDDRAFRFTRPDGKSFEGPPPQSTVWTAPDRITPTTAITRWSGEALDQSLVID